MNASLEFVYNDRVRDLLIGASVFQQRAGMGRKNTAPPPRERHKHGDLLVTAAENRIEAFCTLASGREFPSVGAFASVASDLPYYARVGRYCSIAVGLRVLPGFRHPIEAVCMNSAVFNPRREYVAAYLNERRSSGALTAPFPQVPTPQSERRLEIGHDVWIAANVTLGQRVTIGDGAVVCANSLVTGDVAPWTIVGGNPARLIRRRFPDAIVDAMVELRWWELELAELMQARMPFHDPAAFVDRLARERTSMSPADYGALSGAELAGVAAEMDPAELTA